MRENSACAPQKKRSSAMARKSGVMVNESAGSTNGNVKRKLNTKLRRRTVAQERAPATGTMHTPTKKAAQRAASFSPAVSVTKVGNV